MKKVIALVLCGIIFCSPVMGITSILNSFNAGELSPYLEGRTDLEKYYSGVKLLENFLVMSYGGVTRRPGSAYIGPVKDSALAVRVIPFEYSITQPYIIEMGNLYMRFYRDGARIESGGSPVQVTTPYLAADLFEIQFIQSADIMYLVHPEYAPRELTRTSHTSWTLTAIEFIRGPFLDDNTTDTTIEPNATTGTIDLEASEDIWNANHVGALWKITHTADSNEASTAFTTGAAQNSTNNTVRLNQRFDFSTHGTWTGTVTLQRSYDDGTTWKDVRPVHYEGDGNITYTDTEPVDDATYRVYKAASGITSGTCNANFIVRSFDVEGVVEITVYTDANNVTGTVEYELGSTDATDVWAEGAFSADEGYPSALAFYQERLTFAGTSNRPQTIWMSVTDDWTNFLAGTEDSSALIWTIAADQVNVIRWLAPQSALLIGTVGAEWRLSSSDSDKPVTPTSVEVRRQSSYGSAYIQPVMLNNTVLFAQRQAKKIRELVFSFTEDAWVSPDLTVLAEHITDTGIIEMALQKTPDPILWCVREDGQLAAMTYQKDHDVIGWSRHTLSGNVESVAVLPGDGEDEVWCVVERTINGQIARYIEQFGGREWASQEDAVYVDSALSWDGGAAVDIENITLASPAVVTAQDHGLSTGDLVRIEGVEGMTQINDGVYGVNEPSRDTFELMDRNFEVPISGLFHRPLIVHDVNIPRTVYTAATLRMAEVFDTDESFWLTRIDILVGQYPTHNPVTTTIEVKEMLSGQPDGDVLDTSSRDATEFVNAGVQWETFLFSERPLLSAMTTYAFVVECSVSSQGIALSRTDTDEGDAGFDDGVHWFSNQAGYAGAWIERTNQDLVFRIYGNKYIPLPYEDGGTITPVENTFDGLDHLEGETVDVVGDGGYVDTNTVVDGTIGLEDFYNRVHIGLGFTSYLQTMNLEPPVTGTTQSLNKRIHEISLRMVDSLGGKVGASFDDMDQLIYRDADDTLEAMTPVFTGDKTISYDGPYETDASIFVKQDEPLPLTLTALIPQYEVYK